MMDMMGGMGWGSVGLLMLFVLLLGVAALSKSLSVQGTGTALSCRAP